MKAFCKPNSFCSVAALLAASLCALVPSLAADKSVLLKGKLDAASFSGAAPTSKLDSTKAGASLAAPPTSAVGSASELNETEKNKLIANHDIAILIDKSESMYTADAEGLSRWDWCAMESQKFTRLYNNVARRKLTIVLFDTDYNFYNNVSFSDIADIFNRNRPSGNTNTAGALRAELDNLFGHMADRPLLIAVITDGVPDNRQAVRDVIIKASQRTRYPGELVIAFLQIGQDDSATHFLRELDDRLVSEGARSDIVDLHSFDELKRVGLRDALVDAILQTERTPGSVGHN